MSDLFSKSALRPCARQDAEHLEDTERRLLKGNVKMENEAK